jgi:ATP-dependent helicase/nuclease subunit A
MIRRRAARKPLFVPHTAPEVCVVEASAGSGKTHALAMRYLALLLDDRPIDDAKLRSILAITFTNKATVEMKSRILAYLKALALGEGKYGGIPVRADLGLSPAEARRKAEHALHLLLTRYSSFQVQTIDSFVNALLNGSAFPLGLSAHFAVEPAHAQYLAYSLDRLVDRAREDDAVRRLFEQFIEQYLLVEQRGGWLPRDAIQEQMENLFALAARRDGDLVPPHVDVQDVFALKVDLLTELHRLDQRLPVGTDQRFAKSLAGFLDRHPEHFTVDDLSKTFTHDRFPARKNAVVDKRIVRCWLRIRDLIRRFVETEARAWYGCYARLFVQVYRGAVEQAAADDAVLMALLNRTARRLFGEDRATVPELYLRIAARHRHILIDEFQDTSDLQWHNLHPLVEEALATGGTLFYVGDKKQAIYRFRGGNVGLFDEVRERFAGFGVRAERLDTNYRSRREIVAFNNNVFAPGNLRRFAEVVAEELDGVAADAVYSRILGVFSDVHQRAVRQSDGGRVTVRPADAPHAEERHILIRERVRELVADLRGRGFRFGDIAVLVRDNEQVEQASEWLLAEPLPGGEPVPVRSEKTMHVMQHPIVKEVCALLAFLANPDDDIAFVSFITGALYTGASGAPTAARDSFILSRRGLHEVPLHRAYAAAFPEEWAQLVEPLHETVGRRPLYEFLVWALERLGAWRRFPTAAAYLAKLLELAAANEEEFATPSSFLRWLDAAPDEELFVAAPEGDAVTITTIHKAKGLQFPAVICPFVTVHASPRGGILLEETDGRVAMVRAHAAYGLYSPVLARLMVEERIRHLLDELNIVYVALTRAAEELHLVLPSKAGSAKNLARKLIPGCPADHGEPVRRTASAPAGMREIVPASHGDWLRRMREEHTPADRIRRRDSARAGDIVHAMFAALQGADAEAGISAVQPEMGGDPLFARCAAVVRRVCADPACRRFFEVSAGVQVFPEREIADETGTIRRVDRMLVRADAVDVVDFKTAAVEDPRQRMQVLEYAALVAALYPGRRVRSWIIYCPLDGDPRVEPVEGTP